MQDPTYPLYPILTFLSFLLILIPLPWHVEAMNSGTVIYILWSALANLNGFVNAVVWRDDALIRTPIWCDISTKFMVGAAVGIPAASLCIVRRLYGITCAKTVTITRNDKLRVVVVDICIGVGLPCVIMALHYIVQGHRFDVLEQIGCAASTYWTWPTIPLVLIWPPLLGSVSLIYAGLTFRFLLEHRARFRSTLSNGSGAISSSRYLRLLALVGVEMICTLPLSLWAIFSSTAGVPLAPWISWEDTHYNFGRIKQIPAVLWRMNATQERAIELQRWLYPVTALIFFALFGIAGEARVHYRSGFLRVARLFGYQPPAPRAPYNFSTKSLDNPRSPTTFSVKAESVAATFHPPGKEVHVRELPRGSFPVSITSGESV